MSDQAKSRHPGIVVDWTASFSVSVIIIILVLSASVAVLVLEFPYALSGEAVELHNKEKIPNYVRNFLEIFFFSSQIALFAIAVITVLVARHHAKEAENARMASTYMQIAATWSSERVVASRMYLLTLRDIYNDPNHHNELKDSSTGLKDYIKNVLHQERKKSRLEHSKKMAILTS